MARRRKPWKVGETRKSGRWSCTKLSAGRKRCKVGAGKLFTLRPESTAASRKARARHLKDYRFTKGDMKACKKAGKAFSTGRGRCMWKQVQARFAD